MGGAHGCQSLSGAEAESLRAVGVWRPLLTFFRTPNDLLYVTQLYHDLANKPYSVGIIIFLNK